MFDEDDNKDFYNKKKSGKNKILILTKQNYNNHNTKENNSN